MLLLGVSPSNRSGYDAVRVLRLTPLGISSDVMLSELIKYIVKDPATVLSLSIQMDYQALYFVTLSDI
jgi:hypothetical protein